jgi:hypothetical protein
MPTYNSFGAFKFFSYFQDRICSCFNVKWTWNRNCREADHNCLGKNCLSGLLT